MYQFVSSEETNPRDFQELTIFTRKGYAALGEPEFMAIRKFTQYPNSPTYSTLYAGESEQAAEQAANLAAKQALEKGWLEA